MTANPVEQIGGIITTGNVPKADFVAWAKARVIQVFADVTEVRNTSLAGQIAVFVRAIRNTIYFLDTLDTTTVDDGVNCIISSDGKRFKPFAISIDPADIAYLTRATAITTMIPVTIQALRVTGYAAAGDGGAALYKKVAALPGGVYGFQSADGAWWQYAEAIFNVAAFGAAPDYHEAATLSAVAGGTGIVTATGSPFAAAMAGSLICIAGAGAAGATYFGTVTGYTNANAITVSPNISTTVSGVFGQWGKDNTAAIQAAINMARVTGGGTIVIPAAATYCVQQLDITNSPPIVFKGASAVNGTRLMPMRSTLSVMDWTGTSSPNIDGISVGQFNQLAAPSYGLVISPSDPNSGIDFINLRNVFWTGRYQAATLYVDRSASSTMHKCSFLNYYQGAPNTGFTAVFTANNALGFNSSFASTLIGASGCSDWTLLDCEFHSIDQTGGVAAYAALYLDGVGNISFFGGNVATSHATIIQINNANSNLLFQGVTFYSDVGPAAVNVIAGAGTMNRVVFTCTNNGVSGSVVGGTGGATNVLQQP